MQQNIMFISTIQMLKLEWGFLLFGFLMSFWSAFGQTFFISIFNPQLRSDLSLSHGELGTYYALATLLSAVLLYWCGKLTDNIDISVLSKGTVAIVCFAAIFFSTVNDIFTLFLAFLALRLLGQGMMYMVYSTAVTRRYILIRGRALAFSGLGQNMAEAFFPISVIFLLGFFDWRIIWIGLAVFALVTFWPAIGLLTIRPSREKEIPHFTAKGKDFFEGAKSFRRSRVMKDWVFWTVVIWLTMIPAFWITGLLFHQIFISELKSISLTFWMANYIWYALSAIIGAIISGILVDRFTAHSVAVITQLPMVIATLLLWFGNSTLTLIFFFIFFGMGSGMLQPMINSLLAERYGTKWLGEIKSLAMPLNVIASAASPIIMGLMIDAGSELDDLMIILIFTSVYSSLAAFFVFNLRVVKDSFMNNNHR